MAPFPNTGPSFAGQRIGLLGGSFNPAHEGHVAMSLHALKQLGLDQVWWLVSPQNPLKSLKDMAPFDERLKKARALTRRYARLRVTDIEAQMGSRYTVDTIERLLKRFPRAHFVWLMGMDNLLSVDKWRRWKTLFRLVPIAVFRRPGYASGTARSKAAQRFASARQQASAAQKLALSKPPAWLVLDNRYNAMSATAIRQRRRQRSLKRIETRGPKRKEEKNPFQKKIRKKGARKKGQAALEKNAAEEKPLGSPVREKGGQDRQKSARRSRSVA